MKKSKQLLSMPVISLEEGIQIGRIKGLVVNPVRKKVAALVIEQRGWFKEQKFIPFTKVRSIGDDAVTVDRTNNVEKGVSLPEIVQLVKDRADLLGYKIIAENGTLLGYVDDYYVESFTGEIVGLEFAGSNIGSFMKGKAYIDINFIKTIGKNVIVVTNEALANVVKMDGGLQEALKNVKDTTGQLLGGTLQKTKDLGSSLNNSLEKLKIRKETSKGRDISVWDESPAPGEGCSCHCHESKIEEETQAKVDDDPIPEGALDEFKEKAADGDINPNTITADTIEPVSTIKNQ